jgi:hypothetical protein
MVRRQPQFTWNSRHGNAVCTIRQDVRVSASDKLSERRLRAMDSKRRHPLPSVAKETAEPSALCFVLKATTLPPSRTDEKDS